MMPSKKTSLQIALKMHTRNFKLDIIIKNNYQGAALMDFDVQSNAWKQEMHTCYGNGLSSKSARAY